MTNQPSKLAPAATQSDRPCIKSEAYGVSAERCGCPKCAAPQSDLNALIAEAEKLAVTGPFDQLVIRNPELHGFLGKLRACVRRGTPPQSDQPAQGASERFEKWWIWGAENGEHDTLDNFDIHQGAIISLLMKKAFLAGAAPASQPVAPRSVCVAHGKLVCAECLKRGMWTFRPSSGADARALAEKIIAIMLDSSSALQPKHRGAGIAALLESFRAETLEQATCVRVFGYAGSPIYSERESAGLSKPFKRAIRALSPDPNWLARQIVEAVEAYKKSLDVPELDDFAKGCVIEAQHQRQRWGDEHDTTKEPEEWFWLVGYLAGKGLNAQRAGDMEKFKHHLITGAAVLANWHARTLAALSATKLGSGK